MRTSLATFLSFSLLLYPASSFAQWIQDGAPISQAWGSQYRAQIVSDGAGGAIIAWEDGRNGTDDNIYVQRINAAGVPQWTSGGVLICGASDNQFPNGICSDGAGGAIVVWTDGRGGGWPHIYAQRVNAAGVPQWTADGVSICTAAFSQNFPEIVADGAGGAVMAWEDHRNGSDYDVYAQRVDAAGVVQWAVNGIAVCVTGGDQDRVSMTTDGAGGAIMTWWDNRNLNYDVFVQRVNSSGVVQWAVNGAPVVTLPSGQSGPGITTDGAGGAIVAWNDGRWSNGDIYAQRVGPTGTMLWSADGEAVCVNGSDQSWSVIGSDGAGGAIVSWIDWRNYGTTKYDCYAQRMTPTGAPIWRGDGVPVCTEYEDQFIVSIVPDGSGGGVLAWEDRRTGTYDIYAQRVTGAGAFQWASGGVSVCSAPNDQFTPRMISDGPGGAFVTWQDNRAGGIDVFAQRIEPRYGYWGTPEPSLTTARDNPTDQGGKVILNWKASGRDDLNEQLISKYTIWRALDVVSASALATAGATVIDEPMTGTAQAGRVVWHEKAATTEYYWELVGSQSAYYNAGYSFTATTRQDSTVGNTATHYFRVVAEAFSQYYNWPSNVLSARSVDNLAPTTPLSLTAQRVGPDVHLQWNGVHVPDLRDYAVYRKTSAGVTPVPINFLASANDTVLTDASAPTGALYYIVTAYDVHANQSPPSNEAAVAPATGVGGTPPITALTVLQNFPNPFAQTTDVQIGLPAPADVSIDVFDVAGRRVGSQTLSRQPAGWRKVTLSGRDEAGKALPSGVYFYRISAAGQTQTRKMVVSR